jgi:hypothetical protein
VKTLKGGGNRGRRKPRPAETAAGGPPAPLSVPRTGW